MTGLTDLRTGQVQGRSFDLLNDVADFRIATQVIDQSHAVGVAVQQLAKGRQE